MTGQSPLQEPMMFRLHLLRLAAAILLLPLVTAAAESAPEKAAATARRFIWECRSERATIYLLGSIHCATRDIYPLADVIEDAFARSDKLVVEANPLGPDAAKMQTAMMTKGMYQGDSQLAADVGPEVYQMLLDYLAANKLRAATYSRFRPGPLGLMLTVQKLLSLGFSPLWGVDMYFLRQADGRELIELESVEEQMKLILESNNDGASLALTLREMADMETIMKSLFDGWLAGDTDKLYTLMIADYLKAHPEWEPTFAKIFSERNVAMAKKIEGFLATGSGTYFVVVGSGHLIGPDSIIALLKKAGYAPRQLQDAPQ
jgi:uncharacterized protein YbaP (TraB family)